MASVTATAAGSSAATVVVAAETVAGSHVLTIDGYSKTKEALGVGESVESERFRVGGHSWYIECFPCGWVSIFLCLDHHGCSKDETVKVRNRFVLLDREGDTPFGPLPRSKHVQTFSGTDHSWGLDKFIKITELESSLKDDGADLFQIRCDVIVIKEAVVHPGGDLLTMHRRHLGLGDVLRIQEAGRDVTFEVGGEQFTADRCVLSARSSVFMAELFGLGSSKDEQAPTPPTRVRIDDMEPRVFKALLQFIYTDSLPEVNEGDGNKVAMAQGLLAAADRYGLERLKLVCGDMLCSYIDAATAVTTLQLAHKHGCHKLKEACAKYLKDALANVGLVQ